MERELEFIAYYRKGFKFLIDCRIENYADVLNSVRQVVINGFKLVKTNGHEMMSNDYQSALTYQLLTPGAKIYDCSYVCLDIDKEIKFEIEAELAYELRQIERNAFKLQRKEDIDFQKMLDIIELRELLPTKEKKGRTKI